VFLSELEYRFNPLPPAPLLILELEA